MEDIETMLFWQRPRIQDLHQVNFSFDTLEPQFGNFLHAFYNSRRWTTQIRYGYRQHQPHSRTHDPPPMPYPSSSDSSSQTHATDCHRYLDLDTLFLHNLVPNTTTQSHQSPQPQHNQDIEQNTLNTAINSQNLGHQPIPNTPLNSPASSPLHPSPVEPSNTHNPFSSQPSGASFAFHPSWFPTSSSTLRWSWIGEEGPFITTGFLQDNQHLVSDTESESSTTILFNLDSLNRDKPKVLPASIWNMGQILESLDFIVETLISWVNQDRLRFERGETSKRP